MQHISIKNCSWIRQQTQQFNAVAVRVSAEF